MPHFDIIRCISLLYPVAALLLAEDDDDDGDEQNWNGGTWEYLGLSKELH